jgi:hypothetical protein
MRSSITYRFWRDLGYAVGALLSGAVVDLVGLGCFAARENMTTYA